jgi:ABC-type branched-subunit amino acid transport system ATPase component
MVIKQIGEVITALKGELTVFLAEQNFKMACGVADDVYILSQGEVVHHCLPKDLVNDEGTKKKWLGV